MVINTDNNTYAINRYMEERDQYDMEYEIDDLHDEVDRLEAQRMELIRRLNDCCDAIEHGTDYGNAAVIAARAIIAKCEADQ